MRNLKKVTLFSIIGIFIAIVSLISTVSVAGTSIADSGIAMENIEVYEVNLANVSEMFSDDDIEIIKSPNNRDNVINYGIKLNDYNSTTQFQFDIENSGNVAVKVKNIKIDGIEKYKDNIEVNVLGISVGDLVDAEFKISGIKVVTKYINPSLDESGIVNSIVLDNVNVIIEFEKE